MFAVTLRQARRVEIELRYPEPSDVWAGAPPSLKNIKYTMRVHRFRKKKKIFSLEGPRENVFPGLRCGSGRACFENVIFDGRLRRRAFERSVADRVLRFKPSTLAGVCHALSVSSYRYTEDTITFTIRPMIIIITSAKEVMFLPVFVFLSVCVWER